MRSLHKISHKILLLPLSLQWRKNVWAVCPTGYFLQGLWRNDGVGWIYQIELAKCCKPNTLPDKYGHCYNENIWGSFDHYGLSECKRGGYYAAGLYKSNCNTLGCIEMLKCCSMFIGESYWKSVKHFIISIDEIWWNTLKLSVLTFTEITAIMIIIIIMMIIVIIIIITPTTTTIIIIIIIKVNYNYHKKWCQNPARQFF